MTTDDTEDDDIIPMALAGLDEASRNMLASGLPVVLVENNQLVRIEGGVRTVLKEMPPRPTVQIRTKRIVR